MDRTRRTVKYIFFDVGYTLVDESVVWEQRCNAQSLTDEAKALGFTPQMIYNEIVQATVAFKPQYRTVMNKYGFTQQAPYCYELEKLYGDTEHVLQKLSEKYTLGIIANQADGLSERLKAWGIDGYFSTVISSWDYTFMKPDIRLFQAAVSQSGCRADETVMVGDRLDNDVYPAKSIGMGTVWIKQGFGGMQSPKTEEYEPDVEINSLSELLILFL